MKVCNLLCAMVLSVLIAGCSPVSKDNYRLKTSDESLKTYRKLEEVMNFVEQGIIEEGGIDEYEKIYSGMTLEKELGMGLNLYKNEKDEPYYITLVYVDSNVPENIKDDKMYFTNNHWAGESLEEVVSHFEESNHKDITDIISYAKSCHIYFTESIYVGVPFIDDGERKILIYAIQKREENGKKILVGYGNGKVSTQQSDFNLND